MHITATVNNSDITARRCNESSVTTALTVRGCWRAREVLEEADRPGVGQLPRVMLRPALPSIPARGLRSTESPPPPPPPWGSTPAHTLGCQLTREGVNKITRNTINNIWRSSLSFQGLLLVMSISAFTIKNLRIGGLQIWLAKSHKPLVYEVLCRQAFQFQVEIGSCLNTFKDKAPSDCLNIVWIL